MIHFRWPTAGRRPRRAVVVLVLTALVSMLVAPGIALAVHDLAFQLDGDVSASTTTTVGGTMQTLDWDSLFTSGGANKSPLPAGITAAAFKKDFNTKSSGSFDTLDTTTFTTGSKDTLNITPGWQCTVSNNVGDKVDIMNAYAAAYTAANGDQLLYFALERNANTGDANVAFWFLQDSADCISAGGTTAWTGNHVDGDILVVSAFTKGGGVSGIDAYRWNGGAGGSLGTTSVATGADCKSTGPGDAICATTNSGPLAINTSITTPWQTANKTGGVGNSLEISEFFEGGINLSKTNLAGHCFNVFVGDTRSSQSLTATIFDYARGSLGECHSTTETTPSILTAQIPANGVQTVSDTATVTVTGISSFNGTLTFNLCGPFAASSSTLCTTGGVSIGSPTNVTSSPTTVTSANATVTEAGRYCWRADFSGDTTVGVPPSSDSRASECFTITPRTPALTTQAGASPVDFGNPVTDTGTLSNTANEPGTGGPAGSTDGSINPATNGGPAQGSITFTLYKADCITLATGTGSNPQTVNVSGDATYGPVSFTPNSPGTYHWVATYSGDLPNTTASDPTASDATCGHDANEDVTVRQIPTTISTAQKTFPQDSATITSSVSGDNLPSNGTVTFKLYSSLANCTANGATGLVYTQTFNPVGGTHSATVNTSNSTFAVDASTNGTYYWTVTYATGDTAHTGRQSACTENVVLTFTDDAGPGTVFP